MAISGRSTQVCAYSFKGLLIVFFFHLYVLELELPLNRADTERNGTDYFTSFLFVSFHFIQNLVQN